MSKKGVIKSLGLTVLGIVLFLVKIPGLDQSVFQFFVSFFEGILDPLNAWILLAFIGLSLFATICGTCLRVGWILKSPRLKKNFAGKKMQLVTLSVAFVVVFSYLFLPLDFLNKESEALIPMCAHMVVFMVIAKLLLPLLSDYGLSEFLEVYLRPIMKPLLKVPGAAVINVLTGMFVSVTVAVVMVVDQFQKAVYNRREAVIIISCLTIPSMPFSMLVLETIGEMEHFGRFYLYMCVAALLVSVIVVRLFPIRKIPETYVGERPAEQMGQVSSNSRLQRALTGASKKALATRYHPVDNVISIMLNMISFIPYTLAWGTVMKLILAYTPVVNILTYPYAMWMKLFGIPDVSYYAPVMVLNFIDVVMPTVLLADVHNAAITLKILCMTLGEMVYIAPLLLALACPGLTNLKEQAGIWLLRLILLVPAAVFLFPVFFGGLG
ncbi:nucleoside recognition domain-containing protein [Hominifimenecus sp. rT4P-3]|uniref:nucleoside recognition domain-containing protein n=1 Tax=Hominifimenecus sp. rT4P-3 TaxID=3242979 RepID=UPI003DA43FAD